MTDTNGHGPRTCVIYARVSTEAQRERGLSLPGQIRELRAWAEREGYRVLEAVGDGGGKDSKRDNLDRPGINRVLDLCERQRVDVVVAQSRDRFGEYPYPDLLAGMLAQHGAKMRTPDDAGEGEDAEIANMFRDWMARRERRNTARRSRSKKLEKARQGWIVPSHTPTYGFGYAGPKKERTYEVEPDHMAVVSRIFRMVGVERLGIRTVARKLNTEGVPTPPLPNKIKHPEKGRDWNRQFIRDCIAQDVYRAHAPEEIGALVDQGFMAPEVAVRLDPEKSYGIWWYEGGDYEGVKHRVAVPVPDSGVPREWVDAARAEVESHVSPSSAGGRPFWELSGGVLYCSGCGRRMMTHTVKRTPKSKGTKTYHYYRCSRVLDVTKTPCPSPMYVNAERAEGTVWGFVSELMTRPERIVEGFDRLIEQERSRLRGDPEQDALRLHGELEALARRRGAYQDQQAAGMMTLEELGHKLQAIEEGREAVERELEACRGRGERVERLEEIKQRWLGGEQMWTTYIEGLDHRSATPERKRTLYRELELRVVALSKDELEVSGVFGTETVYASAPSCSPPCTPTTPRRRSRGLPRWGSSLF